MLVTETAYTCCITLIAQIVDQNTFHASFPFSTIEVSCYSFRPSFLSEVRFICPNWQTSSICRSIKIFTPLVVVYTSRKVFRYGFRPFISCCCSLLVCGIVFCVALWSKSWCVTYVICTGQNFFSIDLIYTAFLVVDVAQLLYAHPIYDSHIILQAGVHRL